MQLNHLTGTLLLSASTFSLLVVGCLSFPNIPFGDMSGQWMWLSKAGALFMVVVFIVRLFFNKNSLEITFYRIVTWELILLGGVEAIWGICQLFGLTLSNHSLHSVTGTFYNSGPYSGYLAMIFPICLNEYLCFKSIKDKKCIDNSCLYLSLGVLLLIFSVLPSGLSRSAWCATIVSGGWVLSIHYSWADRYKRLCLFDKRKLYKLWSLLIICFCVIVVLLFLLKRDSASGRLFMWKISCLAIAEQPLVGYGYESFAQIYGITQEKYFAQGTYAEWEELVAGTPKYAFNEYLQIALEWGIPLLIGILFFLGYCLYNGWIKNRISICGSIVSLVVFAFSSYPMQLPVFMITLILLLAACVLERSWKSWSVFALLVGLFAGYLWKVNTYEECVKWEDAKARYHIGTYESAKESYESLYPILRERAFFLFEYGHCLHKLRDYESSNRILKEASLRSCDPIILNMIGKNYQQLDEYEKAELYFMRSIHLLPGRIYPYYLLAKLYVSPSFFNKEKAIKMIDIVLNKPPKVHSKAIDEMRAEVRDILKKI